MTTQPVVPEVLHPWTIFMRASEEARRRGDRRTGTDHVLLALLEDPSIEVVLGVSLQQARQALESLDQEALGALGLGPGTDAPPLPMRAVPKKPTIRAVLSDRLRMTPAAKKVLEETVKPMRRKNQVTAQQVLAQSSHSKHQTLRRRCSALSAWTRQRSGANWMRTRPIVDARGAPSLPPMPLSPKQLGAMGSFVVTYS